MFLAGQRSGRDVDKIRGEMRYLSLSTGGRQHKVKVPYCSFKNQNHSIQATKGGAADIVEISQY